MITIYITGPRGEGKTTIAKLLAQILDENSMSTVFLMEKSEGKREDKPIPRYPDPLKKMSEQMYAQTQILIVDENLSIN